MLTEVRDQGSRSLPQKGRGFAVTAGILGWTLDAFDFFVVVFLVDTLAAHFHVGKSSIVLSIGATLAMRPIGALLFGTLADRYGRRKPLMAVVAYFSLIEVLSGLAPTYPIFLVLRLLYGIGMGGFWGVGASLTLESAPGRWRGSPAPWPRNRLPRPATAAIRKRLRVRQQRAPRERLWSRHG